MIDEKKAGLIFENIAKNTQGRIAVYGLGKFARALAHGSPNSIYCFCDRVKADGVFEGKPIMPLEKLPSAGIRTVVIAAGAEGERIVFERINNFCKQEGLKLYGIQSGSLDDVGMDLSASLCGKELKEKLWDSIEKHDVIIFDIFDTLLMRKTLYPTDVFDVVEYRASKEGIHLPKGFRNYRNQAEVARERDAAGIAGIYVNLKKLLGLSEEKASRLMELEMDVEREVAYPRESVVEAGKYAKSLGKNVLLASDMYLPSEFLKELLAENGITFYDKIYVSDYCGSSKGESLFKIVRTENPAASYMHIGDNFIADGWGARKCGIDSFLIKSALTIFRGTGLHHPFKYLDSYNERLLVGLFLANAFSDPFGFDGAGRREVKSVGGFAGLFVAPLAVSFVVWLVNKMREQHFDEILFAARDGYAFRKMYDYAVQEWNLMNMPKSVYLYMSRKLGLGMSARTRADLEWIRTKLQGKTRKFMENVFCIDITVKQEEAEDDSDIVWQAVLGREHEIYARSAARRKRFVHYVNELGLNPKAKYAFVDMCSQGTSQRSLSKEFFEDLYGLYLKRYSSEDVKTMGIVESFLPQDPNIMLLNNVFEFIFSSPEPSVNDIGCDGQIIFNDEVRTEEEISESMEAQEAIMAFLKDFLQLAIPVENVSRMIGQQILELYRSDTFIGGIELFEGRAICNDLGGGEAPCLRENEGRRKNEILIIKGVKHD